MASHTKAFHFIVEGKKCWLTCQDLTPDAGCNHSVAAWRHGKELLVVAESVVSDESTSSIFDRSFRWTVIILRKCVSGNKRLAETTQIRLPCQRDECSSR